MLLAAALGFALIAVAAALFAMRSAHRSRVDLKAARARLSRFDAEVGSAGEELSVGAQALRRDVRVTFEAREAAQDRALLASLLTDFRDVAGAEEAIFWRWKPERETLAPTVWST